MAKYNLAVNKSFSIIMTVWLKMSACCHECRHTEFCVFRVGRARPDGRRARPRQRTRLPSGLASSRSLSPAIPALLCVSGGGCQAFIGLKKLNIKES